ncbi:threonine-phosphate decarboxylase [Aneurinibacillus migulanus]|uniref:threonine-phosphate decarboxylase n=1 Tax=Aneurinibacillus migulanus TaxID=47500 RepID=A0A0D1Y6I5_ANEMI|nr:threonine-phosphate decarboxylase CobD [Aneurinibacillus migulanus]KIV57581.1 threonine-phosphate decarboxylase [Aneurinibacillus migulanus]KIV60043.1 threonine-phosphate decarboxylase [Aneurinibacillus migulanus]KON94797.1 threonine-phosphate decarboxylase [Aneurinibacillus migulanus]KPD07244.1 threonine-phosphate decarboxylase [Aneurinibacillus migulanus]MCP1354735.1 threonine-phosphate decarboxylase CobD [Aneurinibacillus migulanus]
MARLEKFGHGGDLLTASTLFDVEPEQLLDFSANINPLGPPEGVLEAIVHAKNSIGHYPDPAHRRLLCALAKKYDVPEEALLVGNGAAECMALALLALAPATVGVIYPSFVEYTQLAKQYGAEVIGCIGQEETGFLPMEEELGLLLDKVDILFIGHPNNPTGLMYSQETLSRLAMQAQEKGVYLVIDEAFIDFLPDESQPTLLKHLALYPHVILLRSLTKFYAIPGLRLGFAAAHPDIIARMKGKQVPWSVNCFALAAGEACCEANEYEAATRELIAYEREYLHNRLSEDLRFQVWAGQANFLLVRLPKGYTAEAMQNALGRRGIMIRNCAMYPGLTARDFRIAVRSREENDRLLQALVETVEERIEERTKP